MLQLVLLFGWHRILDDHEWLTGPKRTSVTDHVAFDPNVGIVIEPPECRSIHAPALARSQLGLMLTVDHFVIGYTQSTRRGDQKDRAARLLVTYRVGEVGLAKGVVRWVVRAM